MTDVHGATKSLEQTSSLARHLAAASISIRDVALILPPIHTHIKYQTQP